MPDIPEHLTSAQKKRLKFLDEILKAVGGNSALARKLNIAQPNICQYYERGEISRKQVKSIWEVAQECGLDHISKGDLHEDF